MILIAILIVIGGGGKYKTGDFLLACKVTPFSRLPRFQKNLGTNSELERERVTSKCTFESKNHTKCIGNGCLIGNHIY